MGVSIEDIEALRRELEALPRHQPQSVSKQDAVALLAKQLGAAQRRGYSADELAQMFANRGISINAPTLRGYLQRSRRRGARTSGKDEKPSPAVAPSARSASSSERTDDTVETPAPRSTSPGPEPLILPVPSSATSPKTVGAEAAAPPPAARALRTDKRES
jgi:hypothetical protein